MRRTILCGSCKSTFDENVLAGRAEPDVCPVCGKSLLGEDSSGRGDRLEKDIGKDVEKKTFYYYDSGTLTGTLYSHRKPLYTFQAIDVDDAKQQLKEVCPNSPLLKSTPSKEIRCPRCFSTQFQLVPRKFSLLSGFATNRFDRMCVMCKKRF